MLVGDACRLGQHGKSDPNRLTAQDAVLDAMVDLELPLRAIATQPGSRTRGTPSGSAEHLDGWDAAVTCVAERVFGVGSAEVKALERLPSEPRQAERPNDHCFRLHRPSQSGSGRDQHLLTTRVPDRSVSLSKHIPR